MNVVPIPPAYNKDGSLCKKEIGDYLQYLKDNSVKSIMTTAGTSQFNLLSKQEIYDFNIIVINSGVKDKIIGIPSVSTYAAMEFVKKIKFLLHFSDSNIMALYPDRYYDNESIKNYLSSIRDMCGKPIYLHTMFMRNGLGGNYDYKADLINELYDKKIIMGIKEEYSNLQESFNFVRNLPRGLDIIVAGGSMRRHQYLKNAGANSFLAGVGNFYPQIEKQYCKGKNVEKCLELESKLFDVFNKYGWHRCLRIGLNVIGQGYKYDRMPWPIREESIVKEVKQVLEIIANERER